MCSRAGAGAATTAANDAGAGASTATGENFGVTTVDDAAAPSFRPPRALPPRPRPESNAIRAAWLNYTNLERQEARAYYTWALGNMF